MDFWVFLLIALPVLLIVAHIISWVRFNRLVKDVRRIADALAPKTKPPDKPLPKVTSNHTSTDYLQIVITHWFSARKSQKM